MGKRFLAILLGVSLAAFVLTGCGNTAAEQTSASESGQEVSGSESTQDKESSEGNIAPVSLRFVMYGEAGARDSEFLKGEFHDRVLEELNMEVSVDYVPWGGTDQIATMIASGEKFAFFSGITAPGFSSWVSSGYFAKMDEEMFKRLAPNYLEQRGDSCFDCATYKGDIVLIPAGQNIYGSMYDNLNVRNDILNEVGWDVSRIKTYDDLVAAFTAVHEAKPDLPILADAGKLIRFLDSVIAEDVIFDEPSPCELAVVNVLDQESDEVINWLESEYFEKLCKLAEDWYTRGFITTENLTDPASMSAAWTADNCLATFGGTPSLYSHRNADDPETLDIEYLKLDNNPVFITKNYDWAWAISSAAQDQAEDYIRFIDWMYANQENHLFAMYGVEGKDWNWNEDGEVERTVTDAFFPDWMHKSLKLLPISETKYDKAEVEVYMNYDEDAIMNKKTGFAFDNSAVATEEALLLAIVQEKVKPIAYGISNYEEEFPAVLKELKAAGLDKYVEEYQRQFSEFMAGK